MAHQNRFIQTSELSLNLFPVAGVRYFSHGLQNSSDWFDCIAVF